MTSEQLALLENIQSYLIFDAFREVTPLGASTANTSSESADIRSGNQENICWDPSPSGDS